MNIPLGERATLVHGYTMADLEQISRAVARRSLYRNLDRFTDRYEDTFGAVAEYLYSCSEKPERHELFRAGLSHLSQVLGDQIHHHGYDATLGRPAPRFSTYWDDWRDSEGGKRPSTKSSRWARRQEDFTEGLAERLALPVALGSLTGEQYDVLMARAVHESSKDAADALGMTRDQFSRILRSAREDFVAAWFGPDAPSIRVLGKKSYKQADEDGTCRSGHSRAMYGSRDARGKRTCRACRRVIALRYRARESTEKRDARRKAGREREARRLAAETPEQRAARLARMAAWRRKQRGEFLTASCPRSPSP